MIDILNEMKFNDFMEFIYKRKQMRVYYVLLTYNEKREYKKYIYNLTYKDCFKDKIWEYLNEPKMSQYYVFDYQMLEMAKIYARSENNIEL